MLRTPDAAFIPRYRIANEKKYYFKHLKTPLINVPLSVSASIGQNYLALKQHFFKKKKSLLKLD
jgi:hypothetical protein